jgi:hypothetical protein
MGCGVDAKLYKRDACDVTFLHREMVISRSSSLVIRHVASAFGMGLLQ